MKIFKIWQQVNTDYDTFDSAIVCAENEEEAKRICPSKYYTYNELLKIFHWNTGTHFNPEDLPSIWCSKIEDVKIEYLGEAKEGTKKGVILASFNAG